MRFLVVGSLDLAFYENTEREDLIMLYTNWKISDTALEKISGGYIVRDTGSFCDVCNRWHKKCGEDNMVVPFHGGHICLECLKKVEEKLDRKIL